MFNTVKRAAQNYSSKRKGLVPNSRFHIDHYVRPYGYTNGTKSFRLDDGRVGVRTLVHRHWLDLREIAATAKKARKEK
jgi:hypothetical protein